MIIGTLLFFSPASRFLSYSLKSPVQALPPTVESRAEVKRLNGQLQGAYYDAEYGLQTVKALEGATPHLTGIQELLKNAIFLQQQLKYEQSRAKNRGSSY